MLGIFSWYGIIADFEERISAIRNAGFDSTMIWLGDEEEQVKNNDAEKMVQAVRNAGLYLENAHAAYERCNLVWSEDEAGRDLITGEYSSYIHFCCDNDIPVLVLHISSGYDINDVNPHGLGVMEKLVRCAEKCNVKLALENTRWPHMISAIIGSIPSDYLGLCYDSSHDRLYSDPPFGLLKQHAGKLFAVHLSDNDGNSDRHWLPGLGIIDWEQLAENFPRDYKGVYAMEVVPYTDNECSSDFLERAFRCIRELKNKIENRPEKGIVHGI